jgi:hypothetical protein
VGALLARSLGRSVFVGRGRAGLLGPLGTYLWAGRSSGAEATGAPHHDMFSALVGEQKGGPPSRYSECIIPNGTTHDSPTVRHTPTTVSLDQQANPTSSHSMQSRTHAILGSQALRELSGVKHKLQHSGGGHPRHEPSEPWSIAHAPQWILYVSTQRKLWH